LAQPSGQQLYEKRCAICHDNPTGRVPSRETIQKLTSARIMRTLDFGAMMTIAYTLTRPEREAVAGYLGRPGDDPGPVPEAFCQDRTVTIDDASKFTWNGWSISRDNTRFVPGDVARLSVDAVKRLKVKWAFGFEGDISAFAQPTIVGNQIFIGSASGRVHAMRADSGCLEWVYQATGPIRSAIVLSKIDGRHVLLFGDLTGWFYALDAVTGQQIWKKRPEPHESVRLSGVPIVYNGLVMVPVASWEESRATNAEYQCCTFRGSLVAMRIADGSIAWQTYTVPRRAERIGQTPLGTPTWGPSGVGVWGSPTLDLKRRRIYITTGNNYSSPATPTSDAVMALDLDTGRIVWSKQAFAGDAFNSTCSGSANTPRNPSCPEENGPDFDFGSAALLVKTSTGRELLLAGQKSGVVWAFDPDKNGAVVWQTRVGQGGINGGVEWGMASDGQNVYAGTSDAVLVRGATARTLDPKAGGGLTAIRVTDGGKVWYVPPVPCGSVPGCSPAQQAAVTAIPGVVFSGSLDGHLRAYAAKDGTVLLDVDTVRDYDTVNKVKAKGGAIDGPGAIVINGMVFVNSGYTRQGGIPGNVLLALTPAE
jgi:polyvinyl alcohol dehydrogenase (cytochrome)